MSQKQKWSMPQWMEEYRDFISQGNETEGSTTSVEDLMNDETTNSFNNIYRFGMILTVHAKVRLLEKLREIGKI